jgi:outer membrane protein
MKSILKLITATFIALAPITAVAQSNVAHINVQQLISEMPEVIAAQNELAKLEKDYTTQIDNAFKEFQTKAQSYSADAANQTDITNQARQKELESMQTNLQEFRDSAAQELQKKQMDLMTPLLEKARDAITKVGKDQGFNYVIDSSPNGGIILADGKDLLADVKMELGF